MSADHEQQPADSAPPGDGATHARGLATLGSRTRHLLQAQRAKIRLVEATLSEQVAALFDQVNRQGQIAAEQQRELVAERQDFARDQARAREAHQEAEQLLSEAREGLTAAMQQQGELRAQLAESRRLLAEQPAGTGRAEDASHSGAELAELMEEIGRLEQERDSLEQQLSAAKDSSRSEHDQDHDELRERFEMAVQELREMKAENDSLEAENRRLSAQRNGPGKIAEGRTSTEGFDWEAQKLALMQQMESDFDEADPEQGKDRLTVEGAIRITDQVVADKDREIAELQELLANQTSNLGDVAVGATAVSELLDHDELIREERANLKCQQEEWREKLRQAEVEISVERAKFARERLALDEKVRSIENQSAALEPGDQAERDAKPRRGKWLSRLGLKEDS